jgi:hypothetical protein
VAKAGDVCDPDQSGPQRRCIVTGDIRERASLLRFVVSPGGEIVPDVAARLPGRGLWLTPRRDIVERAVTKRLFARAARQSVSLPAGLSDRIEALLAQRCGDAVGFARRAGLAVGGFQKVREAILSGKVGLLFDAIDAADDGRRKIGALGRGLPFAAVLTAVELGAAFGRERIVHAALGPGPLSSRLIADAERLAGFRSQAVVEPGRKWVPAGPDRGIGPR